MPLRIVIDVRHIQDFGIGTYIRNLVRGLARLDREDRFILIALPRDVGLLERLPENFEIVPHAAPGAGLTSNLAFPFFLSRFAADLFHIPLNAVSYWMPRPYIVTIHDMSSLLYPSTHDLRSTLREFQFRRGLWRAERVIAVSAATRRDVETVIGIPPGRIRLVYSAPDPAFTDGARNIDWREAQNVLERYQISYPFILYAGTIRPQKNIPRLVEAFAVLRGELENHPSYGDLRLIIIGDEISRYPTVRQAVIKSRVEQAVRFLGFVPIDTLRVFYKAAVAFAFPSLYEGFGLPPLEAMACGTPVVASGIASLSEAVGDAAVIVNPENVFDIARGLREALLDTDLRRRLIEKGREQLARFSWDRTAQQVLETYREVAAQKPR